MLAITSIVALALAASGAMASDVYSTFYDAAGDAYTPNFDIANGGCFTPGDAQATFITVSQKADGPYCLSAWGSSGCQGNVQAQQTFSSLSTGTHYGLNDGLASAGSYTWKSQGAC